VSDVPGRYGILLSVAYVGRGFCGFARQPEHRTIAGALDGAVRSIDPKAGLVRGASRTDSGVHAREQRVAFDTSVDIGPRGWLHVLNQHLPEEISVLRASRVEPSYDPRDHALRKTYRYTIFRSPVRDPFWTGLAWRVGDRLNQQLMQKEADALVGTHDFRAFRTSVDQRTDTRRQLFRAELLDGMADPRCIDVLIEGDRFLHRMVRIIVGSLVDVGRGRCAPGAIERGLASGSRDDLGITAPPDGLKLERLVLDDEGVMPWPPIVSD
jgi:tRNA pseudouridine38-40 synthase